MSTLISWIILAIIFFIIELITPGVFFFACLGIGALISSICTLFIKNDLILWIIFSVASVVSIYFIRPLVKKTIKFEPRKSNVDELIGEKALVIEKIDTNKGSGLVKIKGDIWKAVSDEIIDISDTGTFVDVIKIEGTHLVVKIK